MNEKEGVGTGVGPKSRGEEENEGEEIEFADVDVDADADADPMVQLGNTLVGLMRAKGSGCEGWNTQATASPRSATPRCAHCDKKRVSFLGVRLLCVWYVCVM